MQRPQHSQPGDSSSLGEVHRSNNRPSSEIPSGNYTPSSSTLSIVTPSGETAPFSNYHEPTSNSNVDLHKASSDAEPSVKQNADYVERTGGSRGVFEAASTSSLTVPHAANYGLVHDSGSRLSNEDATNTLQQGVGDMSLVPSSMFQFPELPASLLDQGPEYEYSGHTQANVFDAVQDFDGSGNDEAARIFHLDNYDTSLNNDASNSAQLAQNNLWRYNEDFVHQQGGAFGQAPLSSAEGFASFPETSSIISSADYPLEPSTAPSTRSSDWRIDASNPLTSFPSSSATFPPLKRRRESFGSRQEALSNAAMYSYHNEQDLTGSGGQDQRYFPREPLVPSQSVPSSRMRMASWGGENVRYMDEWPLASASLGSNVTEGSATPETDPYHSAHSSSLGGLAARMSTFTVDLGNRGNAGLPSSRHQISGIPASLGMETLDSEGLAKCPYPNCSKTFARNRSYNLKAHLRSHSQLKPFQCSNCPRAFSRKHDLERHSRVHSGDKPYICETCGKGFPRSDALRRHWRVEKECGDKAVEIDAKQPLPSLPPGVNMPMAHAQGPAPGVMHFNQPVTTAATATSGISSGISSSHTFPPYGQMTMPGHPNITQSASWDPTSANQPGSVPFYGYPQQMERQESHEDRS